MNKYEKKLEDIKSDSSRQVQRLADEVYKDLVVQVCKKYNLRFVSGMGTYCFFADKGKGPLEFDDTLDAHRVKNLDYQTENCELEGEISKAVGNEIRAMGNKLKEIYDVLELQVEGRFELGTYVRDYQGKTTVRPSRR